MAARVAVPLSTVSYMYSAILLATDSLTTCRYGVGAPEVVAAPRELVILSISQGFIITPPLAIVPEIMAMCSGVTSTSPWPMPAHTRPFMLFTSVGNAEL